MELIVDGIDVFNPLKGNEQAIIESYVECYGEKFRKQIESNLANTTFVFVPQFLGRGVASQLEKYYDERILTITHQVLNKNKPNGPIRGVGFGKEFLDKVVAFNGRVNLNDTDTQNFLKKCFSFLGVPLTRLSSGDLIIGGRVDKNKRVADILYQELQKPEVREKFENFIYDVQRDYVTLGFKNKLESLEEEKQVNVAKLEKVDAVTKQVEAKNKRELLAAMKARIAQIKGVSVDELNFPDYCVQSFCDLIESAGYQSANRGWDNYFAEGNYVQVLTLLGFDHGAFLEDYLEDPEVQKIINDKETKRIIERQKEKGEQELATCNPIFQEAIATINKKFKTRNGTFDEVQYLYRYMNDHNAPAGYVSHQIDRETGKPISLCVLPWAVTGMDGLTAHELNHIVDMIHIKTDERGDEIKSGFEIIEFNNVGEDYNGQPLDLTIKKDDEYSSRGSEMFNEVVNEDFALKIRDIMHRRGVKMNLKKESSNRLSRYARGFCLLDDFMENHRAEIVEVKMGASLAPLTELFGEEGFKRYAVAVDRFFQLANDERSYLRFKEVSREQEIKYNSPIMEVAQKKNIVWPEDIKPFISCFREIDAIEKGISKKTK